MEKVKYHLIFDTETTGLPRNYTAPCSDTDNWPRLVQVSFVLTNGKDRHEFDFIIKPEGFVIPEEVSKIHGISQKRALKEGMSIKFALRMFFIILKDTDVLVAHNLSFDIGIIGAEFYRLNAGELFERELAKTEQYCTMKSSKIKGTHGGKTKWPKLIELYKHHFNEEFDGAHNAIVDTRACERCYLKMIK